MFTVEKIDYYTDKLIDCLKENNIEHYYDEEHGVIYIGYGALYCYISDYTPMYNDQPGILFTESCQPDSKVPRTFYIDFENGSSFFHALRSIEYMSLRKKFHKDKIPKFAQLKRY